MNERSEALPEDAAGVASPEQLRGCLRDLLSVLALPTMLGGQDPQRLVQTLAEALEHLFGLDACYVRAPLWPDRPALEALQVRGERLEAPGADWLAFCTATDGGLASESAVSWADTPLGPLRVVRVTMNYAGHAGMIFLGSNDPGFPTATAAVVIRAAAGLAGHALTTASALHAREEALRVKDEFLAMLGHELRNPLAPITSVIGIMKIRGGGKLSPEHQIVERQVRHLTGLVDDLLDVARITRGKIELNPAQLELATVVAQAVEMSRPLIEQRRHELVVAVPRSGLTVHADQRRMAQVLSNLLINAAKYTPDGGHITLWAERDERHVRIGVRDTGVGIDGKLLPRIFDSFYQVTGSQDRSGLGLGLALVKSLVELHEGRVSASSAGRGLGSEFVVTLPLAAVPAVAPVQPLQLLSRHAPPAGTGQRVLVVDDNKDAAEALGQLLGFAGHEAMVAHDAAAALLACESFQPSVAVLDIGLPGVSGYDLARMIRDRMGPHSPRLVALTGFGLESDMQHSARAGFEVHLVKPIEPDRLLAALAGRRASPGAASPLADLPCP